MLQHGDDPANGSHPELRILVSFRCKWQASRSSGWLVGGFGGARSGENQNAKPKRNATRKAVGSQRSASAGTDWQRGIRPTTHDPRPTTHEGEER
jgi:hypothetical protein